MGRLCALLPACLAVADPLPHVDGPRRTGTARTAYVETIPGSTVAFAMAPVPGGSFTMGGPADEKGRSADEGPPRRVAVDGFWMGRCEVTWAEYDLFRMDPEAIVRRADEAPPGADAITRPTPPYADETFGFGRQGQPVLSITHAAAVEYTRWLSRKAGRLYRLPTEAEWEWACRSGEDEAQPLDAHAWYRPNSQARPRPVGTRTPDRLGLYDLLGNLAEWVLDRYEARAYSSPDPEREVRNPVLEPDAREYPHVVRGGSWADPREALRCAARRASTREWNERDPQDPQSIWWLTDGTFVGFRVVRPFAGD